MNNFNIILQSIIPHIGQSLWVVSWQISILVIVIWLFSTILKNTSPNFRYLLWCVIIVRLVVPFNISVPKSVNYGVTHNVRNLVERKIDDVPQKITEIKSYPLVNKYFPNNNDAENKNFSFLSLKTGVISLWLIVSAILGIRTIILFFYINKKIKKCPPVERQEIYDYLEIKRKELKIKKDIQVLYNLGISDEPAVIGVFKPKILLSRKIADEFSMDLIEPVILHELIHIKRYDLLINWIQIIIQIPFFFHPFVWYANRKIRNLCEEVCDDIAIGYINNRKRYLTGIINVLDSIIKENRIHLGYMSFSERKNSLVTRIYRLTNSKYRYYKPLKVYSFILILSISALSLSISCDSINNNLLDDGQLHVEDEISNKQPEILPIAQRPYIVLSIIADGEYEIEGVPVSSPSLESELIKAMNEHNKKRLYIINAQGNPYGIINKVMLKAYDVGYEQIGIFRNSSE